MWKKTLGVETEMTNQEWKVFLATRQEKQQTQIFRAGWIGDYNDANTFQRDFFPYPHKEAFGKKVRAWLEKNGIPVESEADWK